ncbi:LacI family DNA-binding transcriptional regulator [Pseudoprimorskyibacter insulae]|uniref:HTH-type transcriptional repressor CytR n=1 Tax=Pseudoprimorskyibacter insulae TaxID=1695997 RepID=A0A2R8AN12_9RHOB|nr:LacI family DNA-binding transcriptional regulator [Pseudoprimorskyibacter insulae]SPF77436.1 HTH-type transcriptional repressor CytR [Pseudoprimorskyibacter insulae]
MVQKSVRIQDVAKAAGVSTATVSRALSNPDLLTESTRTAVFEAIRDTGYRVNRAARNLRMQKAGAVLVLVPNLSNPFFSIILAGLSEGMTGSDYSILIADTHNEQSRGHQLVDYFLDSRIDGMISLDGGLPMKELSALTDNGVGNKIVFACEWVADTTFPSIRSDNRKGVALAIQHLYDLGHRKIAHVTGPADNVLTHARRSSVLEQRQKLGLPTREEWIIRGDFSLDSGQDAARQIIAMENRPTAVFCASDQVAFGLISTLHAHGIRVPEDISVVGFDDIGLSASYIPALTTVRQDRRSLGLQAARTLLNALDRGPLTKESHITYVDVELVVRDSTAPIKTD